MFGSDKNFSQIAGAFLVPVLVILIGLGGYFVLLPKYREVNTVRGLFGNKQVEAESRETSLNKIKGLVLVYEENQEELARISDSVPEAPRIPELLATVEHLAGQSGIAIANMQIQPAADIGDLDQGSVVSSQILRLRDVLSAARDLKAIEMSLNVTGNYINLKTFLVNLQQSLRIMDAQELVIGRPDGDTGNQEFFLKILTYYQLDEN